jgi:hypothetical protein
MSPTQSEWGTIVIAAIAVDTVAGLAGSALLAAAYYGFEFQWPGTYRNLANTFNLNIRSRLSRLVGFRAGPVFVASILIWTVAHFYGGSGWLAVTISTAIYILSTNGRAFIRSLSPGRPEALINYGSYHALAATIAASAGSVASFVAPHVSALVPTMQSLVDGAWTALLIAVSAGFILRASSASRDDTVGPRYRYERAKSDAGIDLFDYLFRAAAEHSVDPLIARSVAVAEILQRPRWVRSAERLLGRFRSQGSYGVMQITSTKPISDQESIRRFCVAHSGERGFRFATEDYASMHDGQLWQVGGSHNGDKEFIDSITESYEWYLAQVEWIQSSESFGAIGIIERRRYATEVGFRIATNCEGIYGRALPGGPELNLRRPSGTEVGAWWYFEYRVPANMWRVFIGEEDGTARPLTTMPRAYFT